MTRSFFDRDIEFESDISELVVSFDPDLFHRAVTNLIINALVHNPPDMKVKIVVRPEQEHEVCIFIRDNSIGMSDTEQSEIFGRYYRGSSRLLLFSTLVYNM